MQVQMNFCQSKQADLIFSINDLLIMHRSKHTLFFCTMLNEICLYDLSVL